MLPTAFGPFIKALRIKSGVTLREHCLKHGLDPGNYSRLERGLYTPPQSQDLLEKYAAALEIKEGSDVWMEFFDRAAASRGELPKDLLSDPELVEKLPVLFRTLRAESVSEDKLDDLIDKVRRS
jgi:transcriptional regulator with XRE-family HTH domain